MSVKEVVQYQITMTAQGAQATSAAVASVGNSAKQVSAGVKSAEEAVKKSMALMGGSFGKLGEVAFELTGKVSGAAGAIGAAGSAAALAVVAIGAMAYAGVQLAAAAFEAGERLEKAGLQAMIPEEAQESLDRYKDGTTALRNSADLLTVTLGGPLLDAVGNLSLGLSGLISKLSDVKVGFDDAKPAAGSFQQVATDVFGAFHNVVNAGTFGLLEGVETAVDGLVTEGEAVADVQQAVAEKSEEAKKAADEEAKAVKKAADDQERLAKELNDAIIADTKAMYAQQEKMRVANYTNAAALGAKAAADAKALAERMADMQPTIEAAENIDFSGSASALSGGGAGIIGGAVKGVAAGGAGAAMSLVGAAGPVGAAIAAVVALPDIIDQIAGTVDGLVDMFEAFPEKLSKALTDTLPGIIEAIPDLVTAIVEAVIALPGIIMEMVPELVSSLTALVPTLIGDVITSLAENLPTMLADGLSSLLSGGLYGAILKGVWDGMNEALNGLPDKIAEAIGKLLAPLTKPFKDKEGDFLGTDLRAAKGEKKLFGLDVPFFDTGTPRIQRGGLAVVHEGEEIRKAGGGRSTGSPINVTVVADSPREMIRQMQSLLGPYGLGETLTGLGP